MIIDRQGAQAEDMQRNNLPMGHERLMIPGPIQLSPDVLAEMARPMTPHYGVEWTTFYNETVSLAKSIIRTEGDVFIIPGSGSAGLDAAIGSSLDESDKMLILSNGFFGQRMADIARRYRCNTVVIETPVGETLSPLILREALDADPEITMVGAAHCESSSGLLNPIKALAAICRERDVLFLADAVSSLGAVDFQMDDWGIDFCVSASQKCLEGPPGLALVALGARAWNRIKEKKTPGWYLNLHVWKAFLEDWGDWHPYPVTMAVPALRALRRGLERVLEEGLETRFERHQTSAHTLRVRLDELGFSAVFPEAIASPSVAAFWGREDLPANEVVRRLDVEHMIKIAGGMGEFKGEIFRIGNMATQAMPDQIQPLLDAIAAL